VSLRLGRLDRVFVVGDETQLSRVVSNLVDNALRYASSVVELSVRQDGPHAVVSVSDDGPGIAVPDREKIWERFTRLDDDRSRASGGSGLGLAMVRELAAAHGGTASVTSTRPAPGATFLVRLPAGGRGTDHFQMVHSWSTTSFLTVGVIPWGRGPEKQPPWQARAARRAVVRRDLAGGVQRTGSGAAASECHRLAGGQHPQRPRRG
jgi:hypothetical protein